jgi:uncharacterized protein (DUF433 family)
MTTAVFVPSAEAAYIAELSDRDMNRVFDEHLVPDALVRSDGGRRFARLASAFARFYFATDNLFVAPLRRHVVSALTQRVVALGNSEHILALQGTMDRADWLVQVQFGQVVDVSSFVESAMARARQVDEAQAVIQVSDDVMGGMPVFAGTRVPLEMVTASLDKGISLERVVDAYPFVTPSLVEAARVYQLVHPRRGRRRSLGEANPGWKVRESTLVRPPREGIAAA